MTPGLLERILEPGGLSTLFQPIFERRGGESRLHALECLTRGPAGTNVESPIVLFEYARRKRAESQVDRACVATALRAAAAIESPVPLALNVHATTLGRDHEFAVFLGDTADACGVALDRVIVEVVEGVSQWDQHSFLNTIEGLRAVGVEIALDDVGGAHSDYRRILDTRPDYLKLDGYLVHGCSRDPYRQFILRSVASLARQFGARCVAKGVELEADLATVAAFGIELAQGWLLGQVEATPFADGGSAPPQSTS